MQFDVEPFFSDHGFEVSKKLHISQAEEWSEIWVDAAMTDFHLFKHDKVWSFVGQIRSLEESPDEIIANEVDMFESGSLPKKNPKHGYENVICDHETKRQKFERLSSLKTSR